MAANTASTNVPSRRVEQLREIGHEVEREALCGAGQRDRAHHQHRKHGEQRRTIIAFVMRSTPLRRPARVTNTPISTTTSMNATIMHRVGQHRR